MAVVYNQLAGTPGGGGRAGFGYNKYYKTTDNLKKDGAPVNKAAETVKDTAGAAFDIVSWLWDNWQLAIVGAIALLILIKRI